MNGKLEIGTPIESWCTQCKADHPHVVATLKTDGTLNKVQCNACQFVHVYRKPKSEAAQAAARKSSGTAPKRRKKADAAVSEAEASKARPYAMDSTFQAGDVIEHGRFGFGRVVNLKPGGKMEVAFSDSTRILVCKDAGLLSARRARPKPVVVEVEAVPVVVADDDVAEDAEIETEAAAEEE